MHVSSPVAPIGHTTEIHLTNINLTSVTRKALLSEFDRVHRFRLNKTIPIRPHFARSRRTTLVQFTRQLVVQLASELHPQWTSVGDQSDDGIRGCSGRDSLPSLFRSSEGDRAGRREIGRRRSRDLVLLRNEHVLGPDGRVQLVAAASPNTSHFLVAQDSLNISILNKLPILPNFIPDTTSKEYAMKVTGVGRRNWKSGTAFFRILPMLSSLVLSSSTPLPHASFFTALIHLRASSPFLLLHVYHSLCFFVCLGGVAVRTLIRQYHPAVLLFLADHSAAVGAEVQSNLIMWLVNSLFSDVHAIDQGRIDLLRSPLHAAAEGRGEEAAEPQHTRLHAASLTEHARAVAPSFSSALAKQHVLSVDDVEQALELFRWAEAEVVVPFILDEPVSPSAHQIAGDQQDESGWSVFAALFPHRHVPIGLNAVLHQHPPRPHCPRRVFAVSELLGDEPGTTDATQPLLVALVLRQQAQDTHLQEERAVFEAKHKVTCLDVVISWRVMTGMSILAPLGDQVDFTQLFTINQCPRASSQNASCCSFSLPPPLLFDVSLRFRPHPDSRRDAAVRRRARRLHLTTTSRSAVEDSDASLRIIYSLALPTPHPHHSRAGEEHASPDNHPRPDNHRPVREVAALVEKALDKRALNLSRDNRNEMQMAARQNTSPSRSILTCSHHPSHHTHVSHFQRG
ncbi:hypothetical protein BLNAU_23367 [Blattamonas nauphoetae]|uniref:Uncharacterized protein n=1 Tax=Blattamonas nauphoetae TaxID=2049346 RepID=A0ABQ9WQG0_9EUKA|nr:hypothetical protein BLNAU_23367 [Blattamonas nauphoetae]